MKHYKPLLITLSFLLAFASPPSLPTLYAGKGNHGGHKHTKNAPAPNGGRIISVVKPHFEFLVTTDRKVQITFLDAHAKTIPPGNQVIKLIGGNRSNPTRMTFSKQGSVLISDIAFPEGNDFPVSLQIKTTPEAKTVIAKFNLNFNSCSTCENQEYACTCHH